MSDELMGYAEIADLLGVKRRTVRQWRWAGRFPEADASLSGTSLWLRHTVEEWAKERDERRSPDPPG